MTETIGRSARGLARWMARATSSLPEPLSPRTSTQPGARATRLIFDFRSRIGAAVADQLVVAGRLFDQPLVVALQRDQCAGAHQRDRHDIRHGDDEVEIGLAEAAVFEVDVDRAERGSFAVFAADERCANGVGKVAEVLRAFFRCLVGDPNGVALPRDELGERLIQRDAIGGIAGDHELWLQAAFVVDREEPDDGRVRSACAAGRVRFPARGSDRRSPGV